MGSAFFTASLHIQTLTYKLTVNMQFSKLLSILSLVVMRLHILEHTNSDNRHGETWAIGT